MSIKSIEIVFERRDDLLEDENPFMDMREIASHIPFEERLEDYLNYHAKISNR